MAKLNRLIYIHGIVLPRWFALPVAVLSIILGGYLGKAEVVPLIIGCLIGASLLAFAHSWNSFHDWLMGFDQGSERSKPKPYTSAQNLLALGVLSLSSVFVNSLAWLALSFVLVIWLAVMIDNFLPLIPWVLIVLCAPWYSFAKASWHPEIPLGSGFSTFSIWLGMSASGNIEWFKGFLVSLPIFVLFGVTCEAVDQAVDAKVNWDRGLRNLGAYLNIKGVSYSFIVGAGYILTLLVQAILMALEVIPYKSFFIVLLSLPLFFFSYIVIDRNFKMGVTLGLLGVFFYSLLYLLGFL